MTRAGDLVITGLGVVSAIGLGAPAFADALFAGAARFAVLARPGRQLDTTFIGAELPALPAPARGAPRQLRTASLTAHAALVVLDEAWHDAGLDAVPGERIGLIVGGSNLQQRELAEVRDRPQFLRPSYGMAFLDTDVSALCTEAYPIRGLAHTLGGASASGQLAVIEAAEAVAAGRVDACIAIGALMDLSHWELRGLQAMGAMAPARCAAAPDDACRPFDAARCGFVFGEASAAVVIERRDRRPRGRAPYAALTGWAIELDGARSPQPSLAGEVAAIRRALGRAGLTPADIAYINPHGTASPLGDPLELSALRACELGHARVNATKALTGHGLTAAGAVEVVATALQLRARRLHPTRNLTSPIDPDLRWVGPRAVDAEVGHALSLSIGFGGITTALCLRAEAA